MAWIGPANGSLEKSGSGGGGGFLSSLCCLVIFLGVIGLIIFLTIRNSKSGSARRAGAPPLLPDEDRDALAAFLAANPDFQEQ